MAIEKEIIQPSSVVTNYHRIEAVHGIGRNGQAEVYMGEYIDADARFNNSQPVNKTRHTVSLSSETVDQILTIIYNDPGMLSGKYIDGIVRDPDP